MLVGAAFRSRAVAAFCCRLLHARTAPPGSASVHRGPTMVDLVEAARVRGPRAPTSPSVHRFHHFLVLDFEATCDKAAPPRPQEIIEFPILRVNGKSMEVESTFHTYVRPTAHPQLSAFCTELTGIVQDMVDGRPTLDQVLQMVDEWMEKEGLLDPETKSVFVTCGDWDLKVMLPGQCSHLNLQPRDCYRSWINIKKVYAASAGRYAKGIADMMAGLGLQHEGRLHSGIDDCKNIAAILKELARRGATLEATAQL
ncbi:ERI1 exoribonuclease 3 isoform X2 [Lethenteron reissneri]|uniref:ERI1 exoribonuclease 3 isoform X2 n=2 Tax=Lethenteron reissneri TaxID=7753 RepID=UPI002AB79B3D|nr:ERI1 exoribonuclease 3 isoform X2 [Lethenteron reissneri]XP_061423796.1 ERI1 exoribonuclease 3 isoform X2 [Lethenteron reissneri]